MIDVMIGKDLDEQIVDRVNAIESDRILLGFIRKQIAIRYLQQAHELRNPVEPGLDEETLEAMGAEMEEEFLNTWQEARSNIDNQPPSFLAGKIDLEPLPETEEIQDHIQEFINQDHFRSVIEDLSEDEWGLFYIPIEPLVAYQKGVSTSGHVDLASSNEKLEIIEYCLPVRGNKYIMTNRIQDTNRRGIELVSRGPNIDLTDVTFDRDESTDIVSIKFEIKPNVNFVQVARFQGRYILRNGYHRCFQLLNAGETHVPAFVCEVNDYNMTGAAQPSAFPSDLVLGARPPMLYDFLTDAAVDIDSPGYNKLIRVVGETINVRR